MNQFKTFLLLGGLTALMVGIGYLIGGQNGMLVAFAIAVAMNFFSYWYSDKIVLKAYQAQPVTPHEAPQLYSMVQGLAANADLPMPRVYIIPSETPNAFATGRNPEHAVVAVTQGILRLLNQRELRGVLAHELSHVKNRDILVGSIAATMAGAVMILANFAKFGAIFGGNRDSRSGGASAIITLLLAILAPLAAMLIQMAVSRSREYMADASGAEISHDPQALASALNKLGQYNQRQPMAQASPQTAHMFTVNPLSGGGLASLFSTHPPINERVARLQSMGGPRIDAGNNDRKGFTPGPPPTTQPTRPTTPTRPQDNGKIDWS